MAFQIRQTKVEDLPFISELYKSRKTVSELKWIFTNPYNPEQLNSFVVIDDAGKIFGAIGYATSTYKVGDKEISGTIPMSWFISPEHKGFAGIQLFKKAIEMSEIGIAIGGSQAAKNIYPVFKLKHVGDIDTFIKVLNPVKYFFSLNNKILNKFGNLFLTIPSYFNFKKVDISHIQLKPFTSETATTIFNNDVLQKQVTTSYIQWLLNSPKVEAFGFHIYNNNQFIGNAVCYKATESKHNEADNSKNNKNIYRGRIVYLPYLGDDIKLWKSVIYSLQKFLKSKGCVSISGLGHNPNVKKAFGKMGYVNFKRKRKPLFIKDPKNLLDGVNINEWHLQYTEGDKAYRSI